MGKMDISEWGEFRIGDIFPNIEKPDVYHTREVEKSNDGWEYVVRSKFNNGVKYLVKAKEGITPNPKGVISFGSENATFFYRENDWISGRDMYYIDTRHLDKYTCLYIIACLQPITERYSYNWGMFPDLVREERIKLPIKDDGTPDYRYMCASMKKMEKVCRKSLNLLGGA